METGKATILFIAVNILWGHFLHIYTHTQLIFNYHRITLFCNSHYCALLYTYKSTSPFIGARYSTVWVNNNLFNYFPNWRTFRLFKIYLLQKFYIDHFILNKILNRKRKVIFGRDTVIPWYWGIGSRTLVDTKIHGSPVHSPGCRLKLT